MILMIVESSSLKQSFKRKVGIESSSLFTLFVLRRENEITNFRESGWIEIR